MNHGRQTARRLAVLGAVLTLALAFSGCGWWKDFWGHAEIGRGTPEELYRQGVQAYQDGRYKRAIDAFLRIKDEHPLSQLAILAEVGIADAYFSDDAYGEAELAYNDFLNLHPTDEHIPYVMYQLGMCHYKQLMGVDRDQTETHKAKKAFERLIARFPQSPFAPLAEQMLLACRKRLGEQEMYIARFYFRQNKHQAALRRFETVAREYGNLGFDDEAQRYIQEAKKRLAAEEEKKNRKKGS